MLVEWIYMHTFAHLYIFALALLASLIVHVSENCICLRYPHKSVV